MTRRSFIALLVCVASLVVDLVRRLVTVIAALGGTPTGPVAKRATVGATTFRC